MLRHLVLNSFFLIVHMLINILSLKPCLDNGLDFIPFVMESMGGLHPDALLVIIILSGDCQVILCYGIWF